MLIDDVVLEVEAGIAFVTMNRPDIGNAVTPVQAEQLRNALERVEADRSVHVLVLTGSGSSFNVGAYRPKTRQSTDASPAPSADPADAAARYRERIPDMLRVVQLLHSSRLVSIAAINGACAGAGAALALASDLRYVAESAGFSTAFLSAGLPSELGAVWFASRLVGTARAKELFLLPERISAQRLHELGLVNGICADGELRAEVTRVARRLTAAPAAALSSLKIDFAAATVAPLQQYLDIELDAMLACLASTEEKS